MANPSGGSVGASGNPLIDGLLQGNSWTFQAGPRVVTYSFNITGYGGSWTQPLVDGANAAYAAVEAICNVDFQQISSGTYVWQSNADIAMGVTGSRQTDQWDTIGYANFPDSGENDLARADYSQLFGQTFTSTTYAKPEGDILIDNYDVAYDYMAADGYGLTVFLHEILHALGLKHPHDDGGGTGFPTFAELGLSNLDVDQYTVMSYNFEFPYYDIGNPSTPMVLDILALQYIYGANTNYRTGGDTYLFEYGKCYAIWDAGGYDTIDASAAFGVELNLETGSTNIHKSTYSTVGIAFGVTIESAIGSQGNDYIKGNSVDNVIRGGGGSDDIFGREGNDTLYGNAFVSDEPDGDDYLDGGAGFDIMVGGLGDDTYILDNADDQVIELVSGGKDTVITSVVFDLASKIHVENVTLTGSFAIDIAGNVSDNEIIGNAGNNMFSGAGGDDKLTDLESADLDKMAGGVGNDTYTIANADDVLTELAGEGLDTVRVYAQSYTLAANIENLNFVDQNGVVGTGNALDNWITGSKGDDILDGGAGADRMYGGSGKDIYYVDNTGDVIENELVFNESGDEARMSVSNTIVSYDGIERFVLLGSANLSAYGNWSNNTIYGNDGANYLSGGLGDDTIYFGNKDYASGDHDLDDYVFVAKPSAGVRETAIVTNFEYLETLTWSTLLPLAGAASPILWPIALGDGAATGLNQLEYFSNGLDTFLNFGLDDIAGADFTITLQNVVKVEDLEATAHGDTITILNKDVPNKAPTDINLSSYTGHISEGASVGTVIGTLSAVDADEKGALSYSLLDGAFGSFKIINGNTLVLDKPLDADGAGDVVFAHIAVQDSEGAWYSEYLKFQIDDVNDNAPVITSGYGGDSYATGRYENDALVLEVTAKDLDRSSAVTYSIAGGADKALFTIDAKGMLSFIKAPDFEAPADAGQNNVYEVTVQASDGKLTDSQVLSITILDQPGRVVQGTAGNDYYTGPAYATEDGDQIFGRGGNDTIISEGGNDLLDGGAGADALYGGNGDDTYIIDNARDQDLGEHESNGYDTVKASISWRLGPGIEVLYLTGTAANGKGNEVANILNGNASANILDGDSGADTMVGGNGSDTYVVDNIGDVIIEAGATSGTDLVKSDISFVLGDYVENLTLGGILNPSINGTGNALKNTIIGNANDNRLDGLGGGDVMTGGKGNDTYVVDSTGDVVNETIAAGGGIDLVESSLTFSLATRANVENLTLTGSAAKATGNALANLLIGNALSNVLDGGIGKDTMRGADGNDVYLIDNAGDVIEELGFDSGDEVKSAVVRSAAIAGIEHYTYSGTAAWVFVGTLADNRISGGAVADTLDGANGNDTLLGNGGNDLLVGSAGDDWLDGGLGNDTMKGGAGKDTYVVNAAGDKIDEEGNAGLGDLVRSSVSINLAVIGAGLVEDTMLLGAIAINATGNAAINRLVGNDGANILDGKGGADFLEGGKGADTYVVDNLGDQVIESLAGAGGIDLVKSSVTYTLGANLEKLTLTETGSIDGLGNTLSNTLLGNIGANRLDGGGGNDTMTGGKGSDTYVVDAAGDVVSETIAAGGGIDTVESSVTFTLATRVNVENLELTGAVNINGTGNALANLIEGNAGNNKIDGGSGNDVLLGQGGNDTIQGGLGNDTIIGGAGADQLTGGSGRDIFDYDTLQDAGDTITGFVKGAAGDVLDLRDLLDSVDYAGATPFTDGFLSFEQSSGNTVVRVDVNGASAGGLTDMVTIVNVSLTAADANNFLV